MLRNIAHAVANIVIWRGLSRFTDIELGSSMAQLVGNWKVTNTVWCSDTGGAIVFRGVPLMTRTIDVRRTTPSSGRRTCGFWLRVIAPAWSGRSC